MKYIKITATNKNTLKAILLIAQHTLSISLGTDQQKQVPYVANLCLLTKTSAFPRPFRLISSRTWTTLPKTRRLQIEIASPKGCGFIWVMFCKTL